MNRNFILAIAIFAMATSLLAQTSAPAHNTDHRAPQAIDVNDKTGDVPMIGNAEIASEIGMSLKDHDISGVQCKVTDNEIDLSGDVPKKLDKKTAHEIAEAYADGRKVRDHINGSTKK